MSEIEEIKAKIGMTDAVANVIIKDLSAVRGKHVRYYAICDDCEYNTHSYTLEKTAQWFAEQHMMKTGHTVQIVETEMIK